MYLYDKINNVVHIKENLQIECGITDKSKSYCVLVDHLDNVDEQGLWSKHLSKPTRCPHCFKNSDE
ncbi:hypothetical protein [Candidatus Stoquefichus sp. SB1]|uniref:hypothetical protein n=1 Tax=Candidatus Stoquefichus sp. SB1 TaxID=1658109 RepID=UPI00067EC0F0|nr:hypothetical protein [Candidatus Stoquefichus sp. SB1]